MFEEIYLAIENAYIHKVRKYFSLISKNDRDNNFAGTAFVYMREKSFSSAIRWDAAHWCSVSRQWTNFTVVDLMNNRAVHGVHASQQSPIFQFLFSSEENHDRDIQLRTPSRNTRLFPDCRSRWNFATSLFTLSHIHIITPSRLPSHFCRVRVTLRLKHHFISFNGRRLEILNSSQLTLTSSPRIVNHHLITCALITSLIHRLTRFAKEKRLRRCFPRCHFAVNGNTVLHLPGPRGSPWSRRGDREWHPAKVVGRLRRQARCLLTRLRSHVTHTVRYAWNPWLTYMSVYHRRRNRSDEKGKRKKSEGDLGRGNGKRHRLPTGFGDSKLLRKVGDVHAARNKPAAGGPMEGIEHAEQERREEK